MYRSTVGGRGGHFPLCLNLGRGEGRRGATKNGRTRVHIGILHAESSRRPANASVPGGPGASPASRGRRAPSARAPARKPR